MILKSSSICLLLTLVSFSAGEANEARVTFTDGSLLSGSLTVFESTGVASIDTQRASAPVKALSDSITSIDFEKSEASHPHSGQRIILSNGDTLPCTLTSLDDSEARIVTWYAQNLVIPREHITSIQFNTTPNSLLYKGPGKPSEWQKENEWTISPDSLHCTGDGEVARSFDLPESFILKFSVSWKTERPRFSLNFCANASKKANMSDTYFIDFNSHEVRLGRNTNKQKDTLSLIPLRLREIEKKSIDVELRVNRDEQTFTCLINNGKPVIVHDSAFRPPSGNHLNIISFLQKSSDSLTIDALRIYQWDGSFSIGEKPKEALKSQDFFADLYDEHASGTIHAFDASSRTLSFHTSYNKEPFKIPADKLKVIYFSDHAPAPATPADLFTLRLQGGGSITSSHMNLDEKIASITHPLLGELTIQRPSILSIISTPNNNE